MRDVGWFPARTSGGVSRQSFLEVGMSVPLAFGATSLENLARAREEAKAKSEPHRHVRSEAGRALGVPRSVRNGQDAHSNAQDRSTKPLTFRRY